MFVESCSREVRKGGETRERAVGNGAEEGAAELSESGLLPKNVFCVFGK